MQDHHDGNTAHPSTDPTAEVDKFLEKFVPVHLKSTSRGFLGAAAERSPAALSEFQISRSGHGTALQVTLSGEFPAGYCLLTARDRILFTRTCSAIAECN